MDIIESFVRDNLVAHHIKSFDYMLKFGLQEIINREPPCCGITFGSVYVDKPVYIDSNRRERPMLPTHARKQNVTYDGVISVNVVYNDKETQRVPIGKIPIMLRSSACNLTHSNLVASEECSNEKGGYFIIKGKERVLVGQLRPCYNCILTFACKNSEKYSYYSEIRSMNDAGLSVLVKALVNSKYECVFSLPYYKSLLEAGLVFRALNVKLSHILDIIQCKNRLFIECITRQYLHHESAETAIKEIADRLPTECEGDPIVYVKSILKKELFYHIGELTDEKVAYQLACILKRMLGVATGILKVDDKHSLSNKRLDTSGNLVTFIFNGLFKQFIKILSTQMKEKILVNDKTRNLEKVNYKLTLSEPVTIIKGINTITYGMISCFMSANWTTQKSSTAYSRVGVSQVLSVQNYGARLSHLRRVMLPNGVKGKNVNARLLHSSNFSFLCPYETPEGERVGLVSNLALTVEISLPVPSHEVIMTGLFNKLDKSYENRSLVFLNGILMGSCKDIYVFKQLVSEYREKGLLAYSVSIVWQKYSNELHIWSDEGRLLRPLFRVSSSNEITNLSEQSFKQLVSLGEIVFRDVQELEQSVVAMDKSDLRRNKCDNMEICPAASMMSVMASVIPFANHSQSPRNAYQSAMGKQAIGIPSEAFRYRYDTTLHVLNYAQQPLTRSTMVNVIKFNEMNHGAMPIVAIMTFNGFNQEDSIILNKASIERGLFSATTYNTIVDEEKKRGNADFESICLPKLIYRKHDINYSYLGDNGVIRNDFSLYLKVGDAIVGKTQNKSIKKDGVRHLETTDVTVTIKSGEEGYLDSVLDITNSDGIRIIKIRIRSHRTPEIGDKFASCCAQKGTCGMIYAQEDLPFDKDGICPDLILNPHAIPSRMTINMLIEQTLNLVACHTGKFQDATTFAHSDITTELADKLKSIGFKDFYGNPNYKSVLYSGTTGEKFPCKIMIGPNSYQRLKHMVSDKIHARMAGPVDILTRQPVAGRSRDGGLRAGPMEIDASIASGCSHIVKELMYDQSDKYLLPICDVCGYTPHKLDYCQTCGEAGNITQKITPFATKLLYQLLNGHGIKVKIQ